MNFPKLLLRSLPQIVLFFVLVSVARSEVKMPAIFGDHMVLQQDSKLPVWGWADPNEEVTVEFADQKKSTQADASGKWRIELDPVSDHSSPMELKVKSQISNLTFADVLVGEVWLCAGQSNMEYGIGGDIKGAEAIKEGSQPLIRLFTVFSNASTLELSDLRPPFVQRPQDAYQGRWQVCSPEILKNDGPWNGFSAVGYHFGKAIQTATGKPVGLIAITRGGTAAHVWISAQGLKEDPPFADYMAQYEKGSANLQDYLETRQESYEIAKKLWDEEVAPSYNAALKAWEEARKKAKASGQAEPPKPQPSRPAPPGIGGIPNLPSSVFNATLAPLIPFAIRGVVWYQGESNTPKAEEYRSLFPRLILDWRKHWGQGNIPFLFVQLAGFKGKPTEDWPKLREAQAGALRLPKTGMAVTYDLGHPNDIHPRNKADVARRLALLARKEVYGEEIIAEGPVYESIKVEGGRIRVQFKNSGGGLVIGQPPWSFDGKPLAQPVELTGFMIAGEDRRWLPAQAEIDGDTVLVSLGQVTMPVAVRYAWQDAPTANLYNKEKLPAAPFRTDDWP